jgi:hypothetical protein
MGDVMKRASEYFLLCSIVLLCIFSCKGNNSKMLEHTG